MKSCKNLLSSLKAATELLQVPVAFELEKPAELDVSKSLGAVCMETRWLVYRFWANRFARKRNEAISSSIEEYRQLCGEYSEARNAALLEIMEEVDVVGMTTTGAAKNMTIVQNMGARVG